MDVLCLKPELILDTHNNSRAAGYLMFWLPAVMIFFIGNTSVDWYKDAINVICNDYSQYLPSRITNLIHDKGLEYVQAELVRRVVIPSRETLYLYSLIILILPIVRHIRSNCSDLINRAVLYRSLRLFLFTALFVFHWPIPSAAKPSLDPFGQSTGWFYRRIFPTALAYFTHLNGYVLYTLLSCIIMYVLICAILIFNERINVHFSDFQYVSIFSSGLIIHFFHIPGSRGEYIVFLLSVLSLMLPMTKYGRATLVVLMFSNHEAAALCMAMPLILFVFPKNERGMNLILVTLYFLLWLLNFHFDVKKAIEAQALIGNQYAFEGALKTPLYIAGGLFFAYKMLWCFIPVAIYYFIKNGDREILYKVVFAIALPMFQITMAFDTSRLIAFGYLGVICVVVYCYHYMPRRYFNLLLVLNLIIPSYDVGLWGVNVPKYGLYKLVHLMFSSMG